MLIFLLLKFDFKNNSANIFDTPILLTGFTALSVEIKIKSETAYFNDDVNIFIVPSKFVLINS